jgi:hypothetical protein
MPSPAERNAAAAARNRRDRTELGRFTAALDFPLDEFQVRACVPCEVLFRVLSVLQSATLWVVTLFFADDALDAVCSCPHGCVRWAARAG